MRRLPVLFLLALLCSLLLGGLLLARAGGATEVGSLYVVEVGTASGGGYHLSGRSWHVDGPTGGAGYELEGPVRPLQGAGCCCTFLPCVLDNFRP